MTGRQWTFFTHHAHVLISLARDPTLRLRDIAGAVGVTERATATLVSELVHAGYLQRFKDGRRNRYRVDLSGGLRHDAGLGHHRCGEVFEPLLSNGDAIRRPPPEGRPSARVQRSGPDWPARMTFGCRARSHSRMLNNAPGGGRCG